MNGRTRNKEYRKSTKKDKKQNESLLIGVQSYLHADKKPHVVIKNRNVWVFQVRYVIS